MPTNFANIVVLDRNKGIRKVCDSPLRFNADDSSERAVTGDVLPERVSEVDTGDIGGLDVFESEFPGKQQINADYYMLLK